MTHVAASSIGGNLIAELKVRGKVREQRELYWMSSQFEISGVVRPISRFSEMRSAVISPDGKRIAYIYVNPDKQIYKPTIRILDLTTSALTKVASQNSGGWDRMPQWSPDSKHLLYSHVQVYERKARVSILEYSLDSNSNALLASPEQNIAGATYISKSLILAYGDSGLVIIGSNGEFVRPVAGPQMFQGLSYLGSGIVWLPKSQLALISFQNKSGEMLALWIDNGGHIVDRTAIGRSVVTASGIISN